MTTDPNLTQFPIQSEWDRDAHMEVPAIRIPWSAIAPHEAQALKNHCGQDLAKLASRGGLSSEEAIATITGRGIWEIENRTPIGHRRELLRLVADPNHCRSCRKELTPGEKNRQRLDVPYCDKCGGRQSD